MARKTNRVLQTTEEEVAKINPDNMALVEDFIKYYIATDHSPKSVVVTKSNLLIFFCYVLNHLKNRHFAHIRRKDYVSLQSYLLDNGLSPARIRGIRSSISSFSSYIEFNVVEDIDEEFDEEEYKLWRKWKNVISSIPAPKLNPIREKTVMSEEDVDRLLDSLVKKKQYQKACVLSLALCSGARKSELNQFIVSDFSEESVVFNSLYRSHKIRCKGSGKLGKQLNKYVIKNKFDKYLNLWLQQRQELNIDSEFLFVIKGENGWEQMPVSTLNSYARTFTNILGTSFYWHSCRHYTTTLFVTLGLSSEAIVQFFGWSNESMIAVYNDRDKADSLAEYFKDGEIVQKEQKNLTDL